MFLDGKLFLTAECVGAGEIHLFVADPTEDPRALAWKALGPLTDADDAKELGDAELNQASLTRAADGTILLLVTPSHTNAGTLSTHAGCRALEVESLDPPRLRRRCGKLVLRAAVTATDIGSTGSCGWDPASKTGILLAKRGKIPWSIVASGAL